MPRRRRSQGPPSWALLIAVLLVAVLAFAAFRFLGGERGAFAHGLTHLNVQEYLENSRSLQGNVYKVEGLVEDQLGWTPQGRVLMVVSQGNPLGVKVPADFSHQNIQAGQTFTFKVRVGRNGILEVEDLEKS